MTAFSPKLSLHQLELPEWDFLAIRGTKTVYMALTRKLSLVNFSIAIMHGFYFFPLTIKVQLDDILL